MYKIRKKDLSYLIILPGNKDTVMCIRLLNIDFSYRLRPMNKSFKTTENYPFVWLESKKNF